MRRFMLRDHTACTCPTRREIREARNTDLNERPEQTLRAIASPVLPNVNHEVASSFSAMDRYYNREIFHHEFESVGVSTYIWIEEHVDHDFNVSCGHYHVVNSYFYMPRGADMSHMFPLAAGQLPYDEETEPYRGVDGEAYYRLRLLELERRLERLQRDRLILPEEQIRDIHAGVRQGGDKPIKTIDTYFDEDIFKMG